MQLDLFLDNHHTILVNAANKHLRNLELEQASTLYQEIRALTPDDPPLLSAKIAIENWQRRLELFRTAPSGVDRIYRLYELLSEPAPALLLAGLRSFIIAQLQMEESPELIFIPPGFHLGCLLLEIGRSAEAETWFVFALNSGIRGRGRFLAYLGDALVMNGKPGDARKCYLAAFLEDPLGVDFSGLRDHAIRELPIEMEEEGIPVEETVFWLPVWGWLKGIFGLETTVWDRKQLFNSELLKVESTSGEKPLPRLWFEYLRSAERLRTEFRDDGELLRLRRKMKELSPLLFTRYMEKIRG
jgi:tetratricopeptide (TPR) repeat protein